MPSCGIRLSQLHGGKIGRGCRLGALQSRPVSRLVDNEKNRPLLDELVFPHPDIYDATAYLFRDGDRVRDYPPVSSPRTERIILPKLHASDHPNYGDDEGSNNSPDASRYGWSWLTHIPRLSNRLKMMTKSATRTTSACQTKR